MKVYLDEFGEKCYSFSKWEGLSICTYKNNNPHDEMIHDDEDYPTDEYIYESPKGLEKYLSETYKGAFVGVHHYRFLDWGDNHYDAGETYVDDYYITSDGEVIMWG